MIVVRKCDEGIPLPVGSFGTWYTWDTWDEAEGRSITRHRRKSEASAAAERMNADPTLKARIKALLGRMRGSHDLDTAVLSAMVGVEWLSDEDPSRFDRDGNDNTCPDCKAPFEHAHSPTCANYVHGRKASQ